MLLYIIISIVSLVVLVALHELGHFLVAKYYNVRVDEFGIGIPPKICSKKIGETEYSLNLLPIGAFVSMYGEDKAAEGERSFSQKPIYQRALILLAGVVAFWIVAFFLLTLMAMIGIPEIISDDIESPNAKVMIVGLENDYPALAAGLESGDVILSLESSTEKLDVSKTIEAREFLSNYAKEPITLTIERGKNQENIVVQSLEESGIVGFYLVRTEITKYPWYRAPIYGATMTGDITFRVVKILGTSVKNILLREELPPGVQVAGPVGIVKDFFVGAIDRGIVDYLQVMVMVSISLAIFNLIPIPALDGGRLLFLLIEKIKGAPISEKVEQSLVAISFMILIGIFVIVTFHDIFR